MSAVLDNSQHLRRIRVDLHTPAEAAIRDAIIAVEAAGCHPLLTDAVILLQQAKEKVSDFVDGITVVDNWRFECEDGKLKIGGKDHRTGASYIDTVVELFAFNILTRKQQFEEGFQFKCVKGIVELGLKEPRSHFELTNITFNG